MSFWSFSAPSWLAADRSICSSWKTFLHTHAKDLISVDFFAFPTATFRVLYVFVVLAHERRKILHFKITGSPSAAWTTQQLREAFPYSTPPRYLLRDRDGVFASHRDFYSIYGGLIPSRLGKDRSTDR